MSAIDDFLATQPGAASAPGSGGAPQSIDALLARDATTQAVPPALRAPQAPQSPQGPTPSQWKVPNSFVMGLGDTVKGGVQSAVHGLSWLADKIAPNSQFAQDARAALPQIDQTIASQEQQYQAARQAAQTPTLSGLITGQQQSPGVDWGRLGGNLVGAAPLAFGAPETAGMGLLGRMSLGAGMGAANSFFTPVTDASRPYSDQKLGQSLISTGVGAAAPAVTTAVGNMVSGVTDPIRQRLAQAGVTMTPGQILGGAYQATENKLTSVPVLGDMIRNAQRRSIQDFNRSAYQNALDPIGAALPDKLGAGSQGVAYVRNQIGNVYNSIEPRATFTADQNFSTDLAGIRNSLSQEAPGALPQFDNIVQNQITGKLNNGSMTGAQWGDTRSMIDRIARNQIRGDASADQWALNGALGDLNDAVNAGVGRSSQPSVLQDLQRANAAYAQYKQIERAAGLKGARDAGNVFTPSQYSNGVGSGATAFQKATNSGLNGQFANDATSALGQTYPDSGTVGRSLLSLGLGAAAGHAMAPGVVAPAAIGIGAGSLLYTALGQRAMQGLLMNRPAFAAPVGNAITHSGPMIGGLLAPLIAR